MSALRLYSPVELQLFSGDDLYGSSANCCETDRSDPDLSETHGPSDELDIAVLPFPHRRGLGGVLRWDAAGQSRETPRSLAGESQTPLDRARLLHLHRCCPSCGRGGTVPREAAGLQAMCLAQPVPGSTTLLGFGCHHCEHEWSV